MRHNRGFVSFLILGTGLMLVTLGLMFSYYVNRNSRLESEYIRNLNYRQLVYVAMGELLEDGPTETMNSIKNYGLTLGGENVTLTKSADFSTDGNFRVVSAVASGGNNRFGLRYFTFIPTAAVQNRAGSYVFSSDREPVSNTINNMNGAKYSSGNTFNYPFFNTYKKEITDYNSSDEYRKVKLDFLAKVDWEEIKRIGFGQDIYYHLGDLTIPKGTYKCNSMVIVDGDLEIAAGTEFKGRMIFLVNNTIGGGKTTIGHNVTMDDGLVLTRASLVIESGCNLTGHFRSCTSIVINGKGNFSGRADAGRPFQTVAKVF